jgi:hypothetical protein
MNKKSSAIIQSIIPASPDQISGYIKDTIANLSAHVSLDLQTERKLKLILTELVTNSIKHSSDVGGMIHITVLQPNILIQKIDKGLQIEFKQQSLPFEEINKIIKVSFSEENNHQIEVLDQYRFRFLDPYKEGISIDYLPEHFGLYIITLASDSFIYQYDPNLEENRFIVRLSIF